MMAGLYPSLHDRFKEEGICPICLVEMQHVLRYSCVNGHTVCFRCKRYYYACPNCTSPLNVEIHPEVSPYSPPPPTHYMPQPMMPNPYQPNAPSLQDFLNHENNSWSPPEPPSDQQLISCSYSRLGCWVKVPQHLQSLHESRCQFRPHLEEERLPTDFRHDQQELVECTYRSVGCKVRMPAWRQRSHESNCNYKEQFESVSQLGASFLDLSVNDDGRDPEELVSCRFRCYGCMVQMPRRRKYNHEEKCNYKEYGSGEDDDDVIVTDLLKNEVNPEEQTECRWAEYGCRVRPKWSRKNTHEEKCNYKDYGSREDDYVIVTDLLQNEVNPEEQTECRWAEYGCRVRPKWSRKDTHEEKCNYRMEECTYKYNGCGAMFEPCKKYAHERSCEYAS